MNVCRRFLAFSAVLACFSAGALPAAAQVPDPFAFRDSLAALDDVPLLHRLERTRASAASGSAEGAMAHGLVALRLYELSADPADGARAREIFRGAAARFPSDPRPRYLVALALAAAADAGAGAMPGGITLLQSLAELRKADPLSQARIELRRALELDPAFARAAILLADLAVSGSGRSPALMREARAALRSLPSLSGEAAAALAAMESALGNYEAAADASEAAAAAGDPAAMKARAEALFLQTGREAEAASLYLAAIDGATPASAASMYDDAQVLLGPAEAAEWERADLSQRRSWLHRFWARRAAESGVTVAARLETHYRRLALARQRYVRNATRGAAGAGVLLTDEPAGTYTFDHRGVILVRHGGPRGVISTREAGVLPNETWVYDLPEIGGQLFHFVAPRGSNDYVLVNDITRALDDQVSRTDLAVRNRALIALLEDRIRYEPRYQVAAARLGSILARQPAVPLDGLAIRSVLESIDVEYRAGAREALRTDSYRREFEGGIDLLHDVFTFRTPFARTELTAAFALPVDDLEPLAGSDGTRYAARLSVILLDTLQGTVTRRDTLMELERPAAGEYLRAHVTVPVVPSEHTVYRLAVEDVGGGHGAVVSGSRRLRDYGSRDRLVLSDVVLAIPDSTGDWQRGAQRLALALPRAFAPDRPFTVFHEIYNLEPGERYTTEIVVEETEGGGVLRRLKNLFGGGDGAIRVRFDGVASPDGDGILQEVRQVASDLPPGEYRMTITVTAPASRRTASTETEFVVTD